MDFFLKIEIVVHFLLVTNESINIDEILSTKRPSLKAKVSLFKTGNLKNNFVGFVRKISGQGGGGRMEINPGYQLLFGSQKYKKKFIFET